MFASMLARIAEPRGATTPANEPHKLAFHANRRDEFEYKVHEAQMHSNYNARSHQLAQITAR
jgi:hypothetical protein